jgi:phosphoribosylformylglycinamidine synthase PurS subunit
VSEGHTRIGLDAALTPALSQAERESHPQWIAEIRVMLKPSVNDPQGTSIRNALRTLAFSGVEDVRAGKLIQVRLIASDRQAASEAVEHMGAQLLANPVIETFAFTLDELPARVP